MTGLLFFWVLRVSINILLCHRWIDYLGKGEVLTNFYFCEQNSLRCSLLLQPMKNLSKYNVKC